ncbi:unnamed protein product [Adineta steineri]|uniref:3CxxC-type domain-containing protein n=1 Tax=Adineta steineri TaxID=433720 RepID=A0A815ESI1_9BILA|nr:unnamed protein product [Adineta steineri]
MTSFHIFQHIFNSSFEFYGLSEWLLEIMPDNVNLSRTNIKQSNNGWIFRRHNAHSKFICMSCTESTSQLFRQKKKINSWSSAFTTILFRARLDKSLSGQNIGRIQMKIFEQGCQTCNMFSTGFLDEKEIKKTFYRLYLWILKVFYNVKLIDDEFEEICNQPQRLNRGQIISHDSSRCDGCKVGWCQYLYKTKNMTKLKKHVIIQNNVNYTDTNDCELMDWEGGKSYAKCLICNITKRMTVWNETLANGNCLPISNLHCIQIYFNTTKSYKNFVSQYIRIINGLFDKENLTNPFTQNMLFIHIQYGGIKEFSFSTVQVVHDVINRSYSRLQFALLNRKDNVSLEINPDIQNMTLLSLQINIFCVSKGLYQYNYIFHQYNLEPLRESLKCEIPVPFSPIIPTTALTTNVIKETTTEVLTTILPTTTIATNVIKETTTKVSITTLVYKTSTKKSEENIILIVSLVSGGSLLPCLLLTFCIYMLCKRSNQQIDIDRKRRGSILSNENISISSDSSSIF